MEIMNQSWFKVTEMAKQVWRIDDNGESSIYLIEGSNSALLIDTGWGIENLPALVAALTTLPVTVVNTHCHPDHACGNYRFHSVYIHRNEEAVLKSNFDREARAWMIENIVQQTLPSDFNKEAWINAGLQQILYCTGNQIFDLGGRSIKVIETPGHSPGSISLFDESEGLLFTGDSIAEGDIWLHCADSLSLRTYLNSIGELVNLIDKIKYVFPSHGKTPLEPNIISDFYHAAENIIAGKVKGTETDTFVGKGLLYKYSSIGIIYREDNI